MAVVIAVVMAAMVVIMALMTAKVTKALVEITLLPTTRHLAKKGMVVKRMTAIPAMMTRKLLPMLKRKVSKRP